MLTIQCGSGHKYEPEFNPPDESFPKERWNKEVLIPKGDFIFGTDSPVLEDDGEEPARECRITRDYYMDAYEVTNSEFWIFVQKTGYKTDAENFGNSYVFDLCLPKEVLESADQMVQAAPWWVMINGADWAHPEGPQSSLQGRWTHPVVHVSHTDAERYCKPEKEKSIYGDEKKNLDDGDDLLAPEGKFRANYWQGEFPDEDGGGDGFPLTTAPVDAFGAQNEFGLFNMIGNVWEWTGDRFARYHTHEPKNDPSGSPRGTERVKKGGSFLSDTEHSYRIRNAARHHNSPDSSTNDMGFRCVRETKKPNTFKKTM